MLLLLLLVAVKSTIVFRRKLMTNVHQIAHMKEKAYQANIDKQRWQIELGEADQKLAQVTYAKPIGNVSSLMHPVDVKF